AFRAALRHREHLRFELRQLCRADQRLRVDDIGCVALDIAMLARLDVEHELGERAMETREIAAEITEARTRELGRRREVEQAQPFAEVRMILYRKIERARHAP